VYNNNVYDSCTYHLYACHGHVFDIYLETKKEKQLDSIDDSNNEAIKSW